jgi:hypothetical protein
VKEHYPDPELSKHDLGVILWATGEAKKEEIKQTK